VISGFVDGAKRVGFPDFVFSIAVLVVFGVFAATVILFSFHTAAFCARTLKTMQVLVVGEI
jgi:hypothetical protein